MGHSFCLRQGRNTWPLRNPSERDNGCKCVTSTNMRSYHQWQDSLTWACVSTIAVHMISIVSNDHLRFSRFLEALCVPLIRYMMLAKKVSQMRETFEKVKKKYWFRMGGAHIEVTTLERNAHLFWKFEDLWCGLPGFQRVNQTWGLVILEVFW